MRKIEEEFRWLARERYGIKRVGVAGGSSVEVRFEKKKKGMRRA